MTRDMFEVAGMREYLEENYEIWIQAGVVLFAAIVIALLASYLLLRGVARLSRLSGTDLDDLIIKRARRPLRWLILALSLYAFMPLMPLSAGGHAFLSQVLSIVTILSVAWLAVRLTGVMEEVILAKYRLDVTDNLRARAIHTQTKILKNLLYVVIGIVTFAICLMTFSKVRQVGTSILASAGVIGIIVGFAAQRSLATLLAGIQIAITQPIRLEDIVVVENEWGRIEEITLSYVVVRIWDLRRLVLPINYFLEKPFQNWTRVSADLLGAVFFYVDYTVSVDAIRAELESMVRAAPQWDGTACSLQVTSTNERTMELRAVVSAADSASLWDLRCLVREKLLAFLQRAYPESLPKVRAQLERAAETESTSRLEASGDAVDRDE